LAQDEIFALKPRSPRSRMPRFSFRPTLSAPVASDEWLGAVGRVTQVLQREILDASPYDAYICGQPEMCESVSILLLAKGIPENRIFRDDFFAAA
jgi:NAD(P)H-flavin reductase